NRLRRVQFRHGYLSRAATGERKASAGATALWRLAASVGTDLLDDGRDHADLDDESEDLAYGTALARRLGRAPTPARSRRRLAGFGHRRRAQAVSGPGRPGPSRRLRADAQGGHQGGR